MFRSRNIKLLLSLLLAASISWYIYLPSAPRFFSDRILFRTDYGSGLSACHDSSKIDFNQIAYLHQGEMPAAYLISPGSDRFSKGALCLGIVVYIPDNYDKKNSHGLAIDNYPPDAIYLDIIGKDFQVVPKTEPNFEQAEVTGKGIARYYQLNVNFRDADDYYVSGYLECILTELILDINYLWNYEVGEDVFWNPFPLLILELKNQYKIVEKLKITIKGSSMTPKLYQMLPLCKNGDSEGRWVKTSFIESKSSHNFLSTDWSTPRDSSTFYKSPEGKIWVPYDCRYQPISYSEFTSCLSKSDTHLHFYGDSNIRRALKAITTGGAWCNTLYDPTSWNCQCADQGRVPVPDLNDNEDVAYFSNVAGAKNFTILYEKVRGFLDARGPYDQILNVSNVMVSLSKFGIKEFQKPRAVIFNIIDWEVAFFKWEDFRLNILKVVAAMKTTYNEVPLIFRTGQYFSHRADTSRGSGLPRRNSRLRVEAFNHYAMSIFREQLKGQILIWDISSMGEAFSPKLKKRISKCVSNHMFREGIDLENQILFNLLCPKY